MTISRFTVCGILAGLIGTRGGDRSDDGIRHGERLGEGINELFGASLVTAPSAFSLAGVRHDERT